jgi:transcriptional regulator with XRE-family HTH domain
MIFEKTFGEIIKKLREAKNLPLREVAEALEIDTSMLGKIEKNRRKPNRLLIERIASFFNVNSKDLTIAFLSDELVYYVLDEEDYASEVFKVAEEKMNYIKAKRNT